MKKSILLLVLAIGLGTLHAQFTSATIQASGLTCAMCSRAIDNALKQVPFVASVQPDIKNSAFNIVFKEKEAVDIDALKKAVEDAGFFVAKFTITGQFSQVAVKDDAHVAIGGNEFHFVHVQDHVLQGEQKLVVVDKDFLTAAAFKKYCGTTTMTCIKTGRASACCEKSGLAAGTRIYHVTI